MGVDNRTISKILLCAYYGKENLFDECVNMEFDQQRFFRVWSSAKQNRLLKSLEKYIEQVKDYYKRSRAWVIPQHCSQFVDDESYAWFRELDATIGMLEDCRITRYILIKLPLNPWKIDVSDIDLCLCNPIDILELSRRLEREGYELYGFRLLSHPLKMVALRRSVDPIRNATSVSVDLYYGIRWIFIKVHRCTNLYAGKRRTNYYGYKVNVPRLEDDLYIRATHAFYHGEIPLADVLQGIELITTNNSLDINYLIEISKKFGLTLPLLIYSSLMNTICELVQCKSSSLIQQLVSELYEELSDTASYKLLKAFRILKIVEKQERNLNFPIKVPTLSMITSTIENIINVKYNTLGTFYVLQIPFLVKIAKMVKG